MIGFSTAERLPTSGDRQFEHIAKDVTEQIAELLCTTATIIDAHGNVVARSGSGSATCGVEAAPRLRVPLHLRGQAVDVIVGEPQNGELISPRLVQMLVDHVIGQASAQWRAAPQPDLKNSFIHDLLHGLLHDEAAILREAKVLGMDLAPPRAVILIDAADYILSPTGAGQRETADTQIRRRAQQVIGSVVSFFHLPNDTICAYIGDGEVAVLKASNSKNLGTWVNQADMPELSNPSWANLSALRRASAGLLKRLRSDTCTSISIGIGRYHPGVLGLARSYQDARVALLLGQRFHGQNGVHCLDQLGIAAFVGVADERTKIDLATYLLSPLDHEPELLETLDTFFANDCSPSLTAQHLSIHRNTLGYRLDKITSLTGLNPRNFDDAVQIRLALVLRSFRNASA